LIKSAWDGGNSRLLASMQIERLDDPLGFHTLSLGIRKGLLSCHR
jgi:hypothetical protein